ncbi:MAG: type II toxin-antitoxin system mRNA interferase toxin, RelE/StbE family [Candidatus Pacebacteria bacterium]|nr:type II toxin-antitoxin system mRNA interferase toxin, RelE/StbE family [Candidatus Paceibacterota bacterium]
MAREIFPLPAFERRLEKFLNYHPNMDSDVKRALKFLVRDVHYPRLKTHKLHGKMKESYACSINYQYRISFTFDEKYIYLESIGSHDDVY